MEATPTTGATGSASFFQSIRSNFDQIDGNGGTKDGVISQEELKSYATNLGSNAPPELEQIIDLHPELMFATIQTGGAAWQGWSKEDVLALEKTAEAGVDMATYASGLRNQIISERQIQVIDGNTEASFEEYIATQRQFVAEDTSGFERPNVPTLGTISITNPSSIEGFDAVVQALRSLIEIFTPSESEAAEETEETGSAPEAEASTEEVPSNSEAEEPESGEEQTLEEESPEATTQ